MLYNESANQRNREKKTPHKLTSMTNQLSIFYDAFSLYLLANIIFTWL